MLQTRQRRLQQLVSVHMSDNPDANPFLPSSELSAAVSLDGPLPDGPRLLQQPLACWHESMHSARTDPLLAVSKDSGFVQTDRPIPAGTNVFLEVDLGDIGTAEMDAVVVWADVPGLEDVSGFGLRFVDVDPRFASWLADAAFASATAEPAAFDDVIDEPPAPPAASADDALDALGEPAPAPAAFDDVIDEPPAPPAASADDALDALGESAPAAFDPFGGDAAPAAPPAAMPEVASTPSAPMAFDDDSLTPPLEVPSLEGAPLDVPSLEGPPEAELDIPSLEMPPLAELSDDGAAAVAETSTMALTSPVADVAPPAAPPVAEAPPAAPPVQAPPLSALEDEDPSLAGTVTAQVPSELLASLASEDPIPDPTSVEDDAYPHVEPPFAAEEAVPERRDTGTQPFAPEEVMAAAAEQSTEAMAVTTPEGASPVDDVLQTASSDEPDTLSFGAVTPEMLATGPTASPSVDAPPPSTERPQGSSTDPFGTVVPDLDELEAPAPSNAFDFDFGDDASDEGSAAAAQFDDVTDDTANNSPADDAPPDDEALPDDEGPTQAPAALDAAAQPDAPPALDLDGSAAAASPAPAAAGAMLTPSAFDFHDDEPAVAEAPPAAADVDVAAPPALSFDDASNDVGEEAPAAVADPFAPPVAPDVDPVDVATADNAVADPFAADPFAAEPAAADAAVPDLSPIDAVVDDAPAELDDAYLEPLDDDAFSEDTTADAVPLAAAAAPDAIPNDAVDVASVAPGDDPFAAPPAAAPAFAEPDALELDAASFDDGQKTEADAISLSLPDSSGIPSEIVVEPDQFDAAQDELGLDPFSAASAEGAALDDVMGDMDVAENVITPPPATPVAVVEDAHVMPRSHAQEELPELLPETPAAPAGGAMSLAALEPPPDAQQLQSLEGLPLDDDAEMTFDLQPPPPTDAGLPRNEPTDTGPLPLPRNTPSDTSPIDEPAPAFAPPPDAPPPLEATLGELPVDEAWDGDTHSELPTSVGTATGDLPDPKSAEMPLERPPPENPFAKTPPSPPVVNPFVPADAAPATPSAMDLPPGFVAAPAAAPPQAPAPSHPPPAPSAMDIPPGFVAAPAQPLAAPPPQPSATAIPPGFVAAPPQPAATAIPPGFVAAPPPAAAPVADTPVMGAPLDAPVVGQVIDEPAPAAPAGAFDPFTAPPAAPPQAVPPPAVRPAMRPPHLEDPFRPAAAPQQPVPTPGSFAPPPANPMASQEQWHSTPPTNAEDIPVVSGQALPSDEGPAEDWVATPPHLKK